MGKIIMILLHTYAVYTFLFLIMFTTAGELNTYINKYLYMSVVIVFAILSPYNTNMLNKENLQQPTARLYNSGVTIYVQIILTVLIYVGGIYALLKIY